MEIRSSLVVEDVTDIFISRPKPKIIKNLPIQKTFSNSIRKPIEKKIIDQIVNDPELAFIVSPPLSKDEVLRKNTDKETQMTDREPACPCGKKILSNIAIQTIDDLEGNNVQNESKEIYLENIERDEEKIKDKKANDSKEEDIRYDLSTCDSKKVFESVNESSVMSFKYTSPLFKACGLTSQVFKQRINFRVMKLNAFNLGKY